MTRNTSWARNQGACWIPEAPTRPGLYANELEPRVGKVSYGLETSTRYVFFARQFATQEECAAWCAANPVPMFVPREHEFAGATP